jgi:putative oxidoreductase
MPAPLLSAAEWQLTLLRIYVGYDMVPHFTEKLFAGPGPFGEDVAAFTGFGVPMPAAFVMVGGLCELGIAIGLGAGLLTRVAVVGGTLYFLIATVIGGHFGNGFIWASPGGGWEYPVLMMILMMSYVVMGAGRFSVDQVLTDKGRWPATERRFWRYAAGTKTSGMAAI